MSYLCLLIFTFLQSVSFSAVNVVDPQNPTRTVPLIRQFEQEIVDNCTFSMDLVRKRPITTDLTTRVYEGTNFPANVGHQIDWTALNLSEMVSGLLWIQERKINFRNTTRPGSTYIARFDFNLLNLDPGLSLANRIRELERKERWADPYPIDFTLGNERHRLISHWNGNATQPGNCVLRRSHLIQQGIECADFIDFKHSYRDPNPIIANWGLYNSPAYQFVLAMEISRRKAINPNTGARNNGLDEFSEVPVSLGVVMMPTLIQHDNQNVETFWIKDRQYHIFTNRKDHPEDRMSHFNNLINRYRQIQGIAGDIDAIIGQIRHDAQRVLGYQPLDAVFGQLALY